jgi:hypothetical protein
MKEVIELILVAIMLIGLLGVFYDRIKTKKGIGVRVIQFLAVVFIIPTIIILALEGALSEVSAALIGTIIGYVLSGIGKDES